MCKRYKDKMFVTFYTQQCSLSLDATLSIIINIYTFIYILYIHTCDLLMGKKKIYIY